MDPAIFYRKVVDLYKHREVLGKEILVDLRGIDFLSHPDVPEIFRSPEIEVPILGVNLERSSVVILGRGTYGFKIQDNLYLDVCDECVGPDLVMAQYVREPALLFIDVELFPTNKEHTEFDLHLSANSMPPSPQGNPGPKLVERVIRDAVDVQDYCLAHLAKTFRS